MFRARIHAPLLLPAVRFLLTELSSPLVRMYTLGPMTYGTLHPLPSTIPLLLVVLLAAVPAPEEFPRESGQGHRWRFIYVMHDDQAEQIRLLGIDCPENS
jgi:hypothetical protein